MHQRPSVLPFRRNADSNVRHKWRHFKNTEFEILHGRRVSRKVAKAKVRRLSKLELENVLREPSMALILENVSPATRLLEKRRQMFEVQEALEAQKEEYARKADF